jgi:hypothetical protein
MSVKKFKFVSPGVFISEIDNSQLPAVQEQIGPMIIGRTPYGPAMRPVRVSSFSDFIDMFGAPVPGQAGGDVWREGNQQGPTYAAYAAQAYLNANVGPVTMFRMLGQENANYTGGTSLEDLGAAGWTLAGDASSKDGGPYGLVVVESGSGDKNAYLAAVWYVNSGSIQLTGSLAGGGAAAEGTYGLFANQGTSTEPEFTAVIRKPDGSVAYKTAFNFNKNSDKFIRNVFNTNPQLVNDEVVDTSSLAEGEQYYWLGETYEDGYAKVGNSTVKMFGLGGLSDPHAMIVALSNGTTDRSMMRKNYEYAQTGWFISQDVTNNNTAYDPRSMTKLFRIIALDGGEWSQGNLKISIENIKASTNLQNPYGTFDVVVRMANDSDNVVKYLERFSGVNLNPASENYIGAVIGDTYVEFDSQQERLREYGQFENQSKYIRVEVRDDIAGGLANPAYLPFGVYGPKRPGAIQIVSGSDAQTALQSTDSIILSGTLASGTLASIGTQYNAGGYTDHSASIYFPSVPTRVSASDGGIANSKNSFFGATTAQDLARENIKFQKGYSDYLRSYPTGLQTTLTDSWVFSLDDVVTSGSATAYHQFGSRASGDSTTAQGAGYQAVLSAGYDSFTAPMFGGFDGLKITEIEPFRNTAMQDATEFTNYAFNTIKQSLQSVSDPEAVEYNVLVAPGVTNTKLTQQMIDICEDRADALAIIDLENVYAPFTENTNSYKDRISTPDQAITSLRARQIDSSYACAYFPWAQARDTISSRLLWVPPSVVALGTMAGSEAKSELWFAPAGFNRGGLTDGAAGIPVTNLTYKLTSKDRDNLYEANVNPIASFPSEGIVVFGQKTMQVQRSALDRINVRRLMIYVKKEISRISSRLLFDQNVEVTWRRFTGQVNPFLSSVKSRLGLSEFRVILDETTTTPDLVDQNIMYAKIFLKPARAIEFIAIDFVITRSGASFED